MAKDQKRPPFVPKTVLRKRQDRKEWQSQAKNYLEEMRRQGEKRKELQLDLIPLTPKEAHARFELHNG